MPSAITSQNTQNGTPFPAWRLPNGIKRENNEDLERAASSSERWLIGGGLVVVFGLIIEAAIAYKNPPYGSCLERWGPLAADVLVAMGVAVEIFFSMLGSRIQTELRRRSDKRVEDAESALTGATKIAGEAIERAANAENDAAEARERAAEIERVHGWRHVSPEQRRQIVDAIRGKVDSLDLLIEFQLSDPEAFTYGNEIKKIFADAGVGKIRFAGNAYLSGTVFGLWLSASRDINALGIVSAFKEAGIPLSIATLDFSSHLSRNEVPPNLYIFVATKPPPLPLPTNNTM